MGDFEKMGKAKARQRDYTHIVIYPLPRPILFASATSNSRFLTLKLLIDKKRQKFLFADGAKDFVDFLFTLLSLLSLPAGTIIRLLSKDAMVGRLGKLYESIETLNYEYLQPNLEKDPQTQRTRHCRAKHPWISNSCRINSQKDDLHLFE